MAKFEEHLTKLESVVEQLERGDLTLEDSVRLFEEGGKLSEVCKAELEEAEGRVMVLGEKGGKRGGKGSRPLLGKSGGVAMLDTRLMKEVRRSGFDEPGAIIHLFIGGSELHGA